MRGRDPLCCKWPGCIIKWRSHATQPRPGQACIPGSVSRLCWRGFFNDLKYFLLDNDWTKSSQQYSWAGEQSTTKLSDEQTQSGANVCVCVCAQMTLNTLYSVSARSLVRRIIFKSADWSSLEKLWPGLSPSVVQCLCLLVTGHSARCLQVLTVNSGNYNLSSQTPPSSCQHRSRFRNCKQTSDTHNNFPIFMSFSMSRMSVFMSNMTSILTTIQLMVILEPQQVLQQIGFFLEFKLSMQDC